MKGCVCFMGNGWFEILSGDIVSLGKSLSERASLERGQGKIIYPGQGEIFRALELTPPEALRVCIVGQDPYHGAGQANGLAFSVNSGVRFPPSLRNIFGELVADVGCECPACGDLSPWAEQGVLLLNTSLTVEEGKPNSHSDWGWSNFTRAVFQTALELPQPVVFLLWGRNAQMFVEGLSIESHPNKKVLMSTHPSPLSARRASCGVESFVGSRPFSRTNELLLSMGSEKIDWGIM